MLFNNIAAKGSSKKTIDIEGGIRANEKEAEDDDEDPADDEEEPDYEVEPENDGEETDKEKEDTENDDEELENSVGEDVLEPKVLPQRETRGRRIQNLIGEAIEQDQEFWGHQTWAEELEDAEWSTEDEGHYADIVDSDFSETESEEDDELDQEQKHLDKEEKLAKAKLKLKAYHDPRKPRPQAVRKVGRQRLPKRCSRPKTNTLSRPAPPPAAQPRGELHKSSRCTFAMPRKGKIDKHVRVGKRVLSQEDHLAIAAKTEQDNTKHLNAMIDQENWKKAIREQKKTTSTWNGPMELLISWSSERLIEHEEQEKARRGITEDLGEPYCREMLFFVDFDNPMNSSLPSIYGRSPPSKSRSRNCSVFPNCRARYRDPLSGEYYCNKKAFREIRRRCQTEWSSSLETKLHSFGTKLKNVFQYLSANELAMFTEPSKGLDALIADELLLKKEPEPCSVSLCLASDDESRCSLSNSEVSVNCGAKKEKEKRSKRLKQTSEDSVAANKRQKFEKPSYLPVTQSSESVLPASSRLENVKAAPRRKSSRPMAATDLRDDTACKPEAWADIFQPSIHTTPFSSRPFSQARRSSDHRLPLRVRSINTFYQPPGFSPFACPGIFGDPFNSPLILGRGFPFIGAPVPPSSLDQLGLYPPNYNPFNVFQDTMAPGMSHEMSMPLHTGPSFPPMTLPLPGRPMHPPCDTNPCPTDEVQQRTNRSYYTDKDGKKVAEEQSDLEKNGIPLQRSESALPTQRLCYLYPSRAQESCPVAPEPLSAPHLSLSSVYCYPSPAVPHISERLPLPSNSQIMPAPVFSSGMTWPPAVLPQHINHSGVVIRPRGN